MPKNSNQYRQISPAMINQIMSLVAEQKRYGSQINSIYSLMLTIVSFISLMALFAKGDGYFSELYGDYLRNSSLQNIQDEVNTELQQLGNIPEQLAKGERQLADYGDSIFAKLQPDYAAKEQQIISLIRSSFNFPDFVTDERMFDDMEHCRNGFQADILQQMKDTYNQGLDKFYGDPIYFMPEGKVIQRPDTTGFTLRQLIHEDLKKESVMMGMLKGVLVQGMRMGYHKAVNITLTHKLQQILAERLANISSYVLRLRFLPEFIAAMLLYWSLMRPVLNRYFQLGVGYTAHNTVLLPSNLSLLTEQQGAAKIAELEQSLRTLQQASYKMRRLARYSAVILAVTCLVMSNSEWSPLLMMSLTACAAVASSDMVNDWRSVCHERQLRHSVQQLTTQLHQQLEQYNVRVTLHDAAHISEAEFNLKFRECRIDGEMISANKVCRFLKAILVAHHIKMGMIFSDAITLPAESSAILLRQGFLETVQNELAQSLRDWVLRKRTAAQDTQERRQPVVDGFAIAAQGHTHQLLDVPITPQARLRRRRVAAQPVEHDQADVLDDQPDQVVEARHQQTIRWPSAVYDPAGADTGVRPVINGRGNHYTLNLITEADCHPDLYRNFHTVISERPRFVAQKGAQGLKKSTDIVRNPQGLFVQASYKAKLKGTGGLNHARAHAYTERAATGEMLHVFSPVNIMMKHP